MNTSPLIDIAALAWFLLAWMGYTRFAKRRCATTICLASVMHMYRQQWMMQMMRREHRIADMSAIASLERSVAFFGSSALIIVAGLLTLLGYINEAMALIRNLPLSVPQSELLWEAKILLLLVIFVYAFFKFTWSMRQNGFATALMGAAPLAEDQSVTEGERQDAAERIARVISMAAHHFNFGIRSYYFALAALVWFWNPWIFMAATALVVYVLYRREFHSSVLKTLMSNERPDIRS
ncbi:MAG: DUF599 family protein [Sedimenticola sp.]